MGTVGGDGKEKKRTKGLILKTLERCRSMAGQRRGGRQETPPEGCFAVYVGPERERFVIRTECVNHPRFRLLLEEAEMEFGYSNSGPLELPCHVEVFHEVTRSNEKKRGRNTRLGKPQWRLQRREQAEPTTHHQVPQ
ncbi:hypothetical protein OPV22_001036 [Ensete ventricosum]|uniref:Auxin-responsive protein n=1 Tax=Ensete ventricosum TaxID=4639 RepID=A0AAV8RTZ5_ENSVE|nr:hypothetical protein OPV22_001036 [Ensete ventricosum]